MHHPRSPDRKIRPAFLPGHDPFRNRGITLRCNNGRVRSPAGLFRRLRTPASFRWTCPS
jgi:hypothetical protein